MNINPFENNIVHAPREIEKAVRGLNDAPLNELLQQFARLESGPRPLKTISGHARFVVSPQPGYGKSHLIGRLFQKLSSRATCIYLLPFQDAGGCWKTILLKMMQELSFPDNVPSSAMPVEAPTQLEALAHGIVLHLLTSAVAGKRMSVSKNTLKHLPTRPYQEIRQNQRWLTWVNTNRNHFKEELIRQTKQHGLTLKASPYSWMSVWLTYAYSTQSELKETCLDWLKGGSLDPEEARQIGIRPADLPSPEMSSREANQLCEQRIADLCHLAGFFRPFLFCFDQTELFSKTVEGAQAFGAVVMTLTDWPNQMTVVTTNQMPWSAIKVHWQDAELHRLGPPIELEALNRAQALELIVQRFEGLELGDLPARFTGDGHWLMELLGGAGHEMGIRTFLDECSKRWRSLTGDEPPPALTITALYNKSIQKIKADPKRLVFDPDTLRWLVYNGIRNLNGISAEKYVSSSGYVTLRWRWNDHLRYFGFESGSNWKRWQAIMREAQRLCSGEPEARVVFFRTPELPPIPGNWSIAPQIQAACRTCLQIMTLSRNELLALYAAYDLYLEAESGDIPFEAGAVLSFLQETLAPFWQKIRKPLPAPAAVGKNPNQAV